MGQGYAISPDACVTRSGARLKPRATPARTRRQASAWRRDGHGERLYRPNSALTRPTSTAVFSAA